MARKGRESAIIDNKQTRNQQQLKKPKGKKNQTTTQTPFSVPPPKKNPPQTKNPNTKIKPHNQKNTCEKWGEISKYYVWILLSVTHRPIKTISDNHPVINTSHWCSGRDAGMIKSNYVNC